MASNRKFNVPINLLSLASDPASADEGDIYYNTTDDRVRVYKNSTWVNLAYADDVGITSIDYITFDTTPEATVPATQGTLSWDAGESGLNLTANSNVDIHLGQQNVVLVKNATGSSIAKGSVVYINGAAGQRPTITLSDADTEATSSKTLGLTAETIADGAEGFVTTFGVQRGVNTLGMAEGAALWLSSTAGGYTTSIPAEPAHSVFIGYVVKASESAGEVFVNPQNGYELDELHGVTIEASGSLADNEVLAYDNASGIWINQTAEEAGLATSGHTHSLDDLSDVSTSGATTNDVLQFNGTAWVPAAVSAGATGSGVKLSFIAVGSTPSVDGDFTYASTPSVGNSNTIRVDEGDLNGVNITDIIAVLDDSTATNKAILYFTNADGTKVHTWKVTNQSDAGTYRNITAVSMTYGSAFTVGETVYMTAALSGDDGGTGSAGVDAGPTWSYSTTTTDADPGSGTFRANNTTESSATFLYVDNLDSNGDDMTAWFATWDDSTTTGNYGYLTLNNGNVNINIYQVTSVTAATGYYKIGVTWVAGSGTISGAYDTVFSFARTGDKGATGATGAAGYGNKSVVLSDRSSTTSPLDVFGSTNNVFTLSASKTYEFRGQIIYSVAYAGTTAFGVNFVPVFSSAPASGDFYYTYKTYNQAAGTAFNQRAYVTATSSTQIAATASANVNIIFEFEGIFRSTATGGTFTPRIGFTAGGSAPYNTLTITKNSWISISELGDSTSEVFGTGWA